MEIGYSYSVKSRKVYEKKIEENYNKMNNPGYDPDESNAVKKYFEIKKVAKKQKTSHDFSM